MERHTGTRPAGVYARTDRVAVLVLVFSLSACASLPESRTTVPSTVITDTADTALGRRLPTTLAALNAPGGVHLLPDGPSAFLARLAMVRAAERSIDAQYYIWQRDTTGRMLIAELLRAADRGVRVRLLIDDFGSAANDRDLLILDQHANIEVRLFNPIANRSRRTLSTTGDFARVNRRMHNKSLTVDNRLTIVGGRNIGDEYFEAGQGLFYRDLDALAIGAVVADVSARFDRYWNSPVVWGITDLTSIKPTAEEARKAFDGLAAFERQQEGQAFERAMLASSLARQIREGSVDFVGADVRVLADDPAKVEQPDGNRSNLLLPKLLPELERLPRAADPDLALFRAWPGGRGVPAPHPRTRRAGAGAHQLAELRRRAAGIRHLPEVPPRTAGGRYRALRDQPWRRAGQPARSKPRLRPGRSTAAVPRTPRCTARCWCSIAGQFSSAR